MYYVEYIPYVCGVTKKYNIGNRYLKDKVNKVAVSEKIKIETGLKGKGWR